ncbi:hypothetical protein DFJ73DRAFT_884944 [Zopfochytrium polystomum]|nr:hypothetical protein DFJ73DRAFT_884944 [Zopfochytrium polystomum]
MMRLLLSSPLRCLLVSLIFFFFFFSSLFLNPHLVLPNPFHLPLPSSQPGRSCSLPLTTPQPNPTSLPSLPLAVFLEEKCPSFSFSDNLCVCVCVCV